MASTELANLTAATAAGRADLLYIDQGGVSKKLTIELLEDLLGIRKARVSSQHAISSATATEVTDLSLTLVAGTYRFSYHLICQTTTTTVGVGFAINYTGTASKIVYQLKYHDTANGASTGTADDVDNSSTGRTVAGAVSKTEGTTTATVSVGGFATANSDTLLLLEGTVVVTDGGDIELWHASESASQTSVEVGSNLILVRIA